MSLKVREGGEWVQVSSADGANGANGLDGVDAKVLQIQYKESNAAVTITQQNVYPITGLSVTINPIKSNTKLLLEANIVSNAYYVSSFGFAYMNTTPFTRLGGNTNTNSTNAISTLFSYGDAWAASPSRTTPNPTGFSPDFSAENMYSLKYRYLYTQSGLTPVGGLTFAPTACSSWSNAINTLTINNRLNNDMLSTSSITVKEIEE